MQMEQYMDLVGYEVECEVTLEQMWSENLTKCTREIN